MKHFDLSLPDGSTNPKIHKVSNEVFRKALVDFPREIAERMVELGFGRWIPFTPAGDVPVPQSLTYPEQIFFVNLQTHAVKGVHVTSLVEDLGPIPADLPMFCSHLFENAAFEHDSKDLEDVTFNEEDTLENLLDELPMCEETPEPVETRAPKLPADPSVNKGEAAKKKKADEVNEALAEKIKDDVVGDSSEVPDPPTQEK